MSDDQHAIRFTYLSQEDLLESGCLDFELAIEAAESALLAHRDGDVIFPEKVVQIFDEETQKRINCLPATLLNENVCGMKWVSVFPPNVSEFGLQNLTALFVLSETRKGFPLAVLEGTLASNIRVGAMGGLAARHLAPSEPRTIGFIGAGEQAKMHLLAMKTVCPSLEECRVAARAFLKAIRPLASISRARWFSSFLDQRMRIARLRLSHEWQASTTQRRARQVGSRSLVASSSPRLRMWGSNRCASASARTSS